MYADDAVIFSKPKSGLQNMLDKLNVYCKRWNLKVNVDKIKVMIFELGRNTFVDIYFDGTKLELVVSFKYHAWINFFSKMANGIEVKR